MVISKGIVRCHTTPPMMCGFVKGLRYNFVEYSGRIELLRDGKKCRMFPGGWIIFWRYFKVKRITYHIDDV